MSGQKARLAVQVACLFAEVLNSLNMPFEVLGYNTSAMPWDLRQKGEKNGFSRFDIVNHWVFKEFNEGWSTVHSRLGACCNGMRTSFGFKDGWIDTDAIPLNQKVVKDLDGCVGGANCDHETILLGAHRLFAQPQERKIQVVISDGIPNGHYGDYGGQLQHMLVAINNRIIAAGIEQVAFGIQCDGVKKFYSKCVVINNLDELGPEALKYLSSSLRNYAMTTPDRWNT
jgi:cobalamin biosynthesis protein CobT